MIILSVGELAGRRPLVGIAGEATVTEACRRLHEQRIGALAVLDGDGLAGILSERDVISRVIAAGRDPAATLVREAMTPDPRTIDHEGSLADALQAMLDGHFRHLPVTRDGAVIGMISMRDIPTEYRLLRERYEDARKVEA
jgi:CBS domain-containing protein